MSQIADFMTPGWWGVFAVLARAGGFAASAPTPGVGTEGVRFRVYSAIILSLMLLPFAPTQVGSMSGAESFAHLLHGLAVGCLLGFALRVLLSGIALAAQLIEQQLGFPVVAVQDDDESTTVVSRLYQILAIALFFTFGGHRLVMAGLIDAGATGWETTRGNGAVEVAVASVSQACWFAVRIAMPLLLALLTASLTVGMISRVLPQSPAAAVALPVQVAFGLMLILLSVATLVPTIRSELTGALGWLAASH